MVCYAWRTSAEHCPVCLTCRLVRADWKSDTHETAPGGVMDVYTLHKSLFEVHRWTPEHAWPPVDGWFTLHECNSVLNSLSTFGPTASARKSTRYGRGDLSHLIHTNVHTQPYSHTMQEWLLSLLFAITYFPEAATDMPMWKR